MKISFLGIGIMGAGMATNLLKEHGEITVWNRTRDKAEALVPLGAKVADTIEDATINADVVITMLTTPQVVEELALGEKGFMKYLQKMTLWMDCSSVNPSFSKRLATESLAKKVRFVDAPVAGSKIPAEKGELTFFAGGEEMDVEQVRPLMQIMGSKIIHAGPCGAGSSLKMVVNLMLGQVMAAFSESVKFGKKLGLPEEFLLDELPELAVTPPIVKIKKEKFKSGDYSEEFPLEHMHKDLFLASLAAFENEAFLPMGSMAKELFGLAKSSGLGREDFSAIYKYINNMD